MAEWQVIEDQNYVTGKCPFSNISIRTFINTNFSVLVMKSLMH